MRNIKWPSIGQFRNVVDGIRKSHNYRGKNEEGVPIYENTSPYPVIKFSGTVKLHGTNAGITYDLESETLYVQTRNNSISLDQEGHFGFVDWVKYNKEFFLKQIEEFTRDLKGPSVKTVTLFGEWAGEGVQKNVGISELPKAFYLFSVVTDTGEEDGTRYYSPSEIEVSPEISYYNILDFPHYYVEIDFNKPEYATEELSRLTLEVEKECPVSKQLGIEKGLGEGIVWTGEHEGTIYRFKVKGAKHSVSKVKTLAPISVEKLESIDAFVEYAVTKDRVSQAEVEVWATSMEYTGEVVRWVIKDILKEEKDVLEENGLEWEEVVKKVGKRAAHLFHKYLD